MKPHPLMSLFSDQLMESAAEEVLLLLSWLHLHDLDWDRGDDFRQTIGSDAISGSQTCYSSDLVDAYYDPPC